MSRPAPSIARRLAVVVVLLGAFTLLLAVSAVQNGNIAEASVPAPEGPAAPSPSASGSPTPAAPPSAQVSLVRAACDTVRLSAQTDPGVTLSYRITDEGGGVASTGTFTGSLDRTIWLSTGHNYTAVLSAAQDGSQLASSATVNLHETCPVTVAADAPEFSDPCGTEHDVVVVPKIIGVDYRVGGTLLVPGANAAIGVVTVQAVARAGYTLTGPSAWSHDFTADPCLAGPEPQVQGPRPPATSAPGVAPSAGVSPPESPAQSPPAAATPTRSAPSQRDDAAVRSQPEPAVEASVGGPGPLAWGIMIAIAVAGGIVFWLKTRH